MTAPHPFVLLTGLAGAGLSSALNIFEDLGYRAFDNFPLQLIEDLLSKTPAGEGPVAVAIDTRAPDFDSREVMAILARIGLAGGRTAQLVFLTCDATVLLGRFNETRRRHPLAVDRPVEDGIRKDQHLTYSLRLVADLVIDTSEMSTHDLRHVLAGHYALSESPRPLTVVLESFSYRRGLPREADLVFDVRFLKNPHWDKDLRPKTGQDEAVQAYIAQDPDFERYFENIKAQLELALPRLAGARAYLTIAIGCTGGKHRSVCLVEKLKEWLIGQGYDPVVRHRELERA